MGDGSKEETTVPVHIKFSFTTTMQLMIEINSTFEDNYDLITFSCPNISLKSHYPGQNYGVISMRQGDITEKHIILIGGDNGEDNEDDSTSGVVSSLSSLIVITFIAMIFL